MTTVHARDAGEALVRLEGMALLAGTPLTAARAQLRGALDLLIVLSRGPSQQRGVVQIAEVAGEDTGPVQARDLWRRESW